MQLFATTVDHIDQTNRVALKLRHLIRYFSRAEPSEKSYALALWSGLQPGRVIPQSALVEWCAGASGLPAWLFAQSLQTAADPSEAVAILSPPPTGTPAPGLAEVWRQLEGLKGQDPEEIRSAVEATWQRLGIPERYVYNKLLTGTFRPGISEAVLISALEAYTGEPAHSLTWRLAGKWHPARTTFDALLRSPSDGAATAHPYPFAVYHPVERLTSADGDETWWACYLQDGLRCQLVRRADYFALWSEDGRLLTDKFPELAGLRQHLPEGTVLDGTLRLTDSALPGQLERRIRLKKPTPKVLRELPVEYVADDLPELYGEDLREQPLAVRWSILTGLIEVTGHPHLVLPELLSFDAAAELTAHWRACRDAMSAGIRIKPWHGPYPAAAKAEAWLEWKARPLTVTAILLYASAGAQARSANKTEFTFAVWQEETLVPIGKASEGLSGEELAEINAFVKANTLERFGPVRSVVPELVLELQFDRISASTRHKAGLVLDGLTIAQWHRGRPVADAHTLDDLKAWL